MNRPWIPLAVYLLISGSGDEGRGISEAVKKSVVPGRTDTSGKMDFNAPYMLAALRANWGVQ